MAIAQAIMLTVVTLSCRIDSRCRHWMLWALWRSTRCHCTKSGAFPVKRGEILTEYAMPCPHIVAVALLKRLPHNEWIRRSYSKLLMNDYYNSLKTSSVRPVPLQNTQPDGVTFCFERKKSPGRPSKYRMNGTREDYRRYAHGEEASRTISED